MLLRLQPPSKLQAPPKDPEVPVIASTANGTAQHGHSRPSALPPGSCQEAMGGGGGVGFDLETVPQP